MKRRKDNFTDFVEAAQSQQDKPASQESSGKDRDEVLDDEGNVIVLGQNGGKQTLPPHSMKSLELSPEVIKAIEVAVRSAMDKAIEKFMKTLKEKTPNHE